MVSRVRTPRRFWIALTAAILLVAAGCGTTSRRPDNSASKAAEPAKPAAAAAAGNSAGSADNSPKRDLDQDEERGGHTLRRHVGKTDAELKLRLEGEEISGASTYTDLDTAERIVAAVLDADRERVEAWANRSSSRHPNLVLRYQADHPIGRTLPRNSNTPVACDHALVVLKWSGPGQFFVLTSYPDCE